MGPGKWFDLRIIDYKGHSSKAQRWSDSITVSNIKLGVLSN